MMMVYFIKGTIQIGSVMCVLSFSDEAALDAPFIWIHLCHYHLRRRKDIEINVFVQVLFNDFLMICAKIAFPSYVSF